MQLRLHLDKLDRNQNRRLRGRRLSVSVDLSEVESSRQNLRHGNKMHNENSTAGKEQVPQDTLERILKLAHSGLSPEDISLMIRNDIETVQQVIANDPEHRARVIQLIKERSAEYRCAQSNRLMISPVMARDENFYEQSILEADPSFSRNQFIPSKKFKAKIADFSKESLKVLERYLRQKDPQEDILKMTAECLSVVISDAGLECALRVLGSVEGEVLRKLSGMLRNLVPDEMLIGLMSQLVRQLPSHALCLAALIILEAHSERALEEAFRCFTELLSQTALGPEAIDLAEEVSERLSSYQLGQMNAALGACPREGKDRLDGLKLKEAYALLREGKVEAAICLVNTLHITPHLEKEVLRFFDEAGLSSGKEPILEQRLSGKLEEISRDSPSIAEALSVVHQLLNAELHSRKSEATSQSLISLKTEVLNETLAKLGQPTSQALIAQDARIQRLEEQTQRKEAECQETLSSLRAKVQALAEELVKAGEEISQVKRAQDAWIQRSETDMQESLISVRTELRALHELIAKSEDEAKRIQSFIEQSEKAEAATQEVLSSLKGEVGVLSKGLAQIASQCKSAQSDQEALLQRLKEQSKKTQTNTLDLILKTTQELQAQQYLSLESITLPTFIYSYMCDTSELNRTDLVTGEESSHPVPSYRFKPFCCWSEVPGGSLLITGGGYPAASEVVSIDVRTFEVSRQRDMLTPRRNHAAVHHAPHLYVLGGLNGGGSFSECERYVCAENRWEALPPLPRPCNGTSGVVLESSLYALGGHDGSPLDLVQKLSLESLTWELMQLRLPYESSCIPCFKLSDTEAYLVVNETLCSFTALGVRPLKTLTDDIQSWNGPSYYHSGTLYSSSNDGAARSYEIGKLN